MKNATLMVLILFIVFVIACSPASKELSSTPVATDAGTEVPTLYIPPAIPGEVVYIPFPVKISADGDLSDWKDIPSYIVDYGPSPSKDPAEDGSFTFSVAADMDNFYITMQAQDKNVIAGQHGTDFWNEDSMEFYVNASGDLGSEKYQTGIFQININAADIGNTDPNTLKISGVFSTGIPITGYVFKTENGWGFEVAAPFQDMFVPYHGEEIGFQTQLNGASVKDRDVKLIWSKADTSDQSWQNPRLFGRGIFFELGRTDIPEPSAIVAVQTITPTTGPIVIPALVSVNQTGYFPNGTKIALIASDLKEPQEWSLQSSSGELLMTGKTIVKGYDPASGDSIQSIDFSSFTKPGSGYVIESGGLKSVPFAISTDIYSQVEKDAMTYFYDNRSGTVIDAQYAGEQWARPAGHLTDHNVTCYKGTDSGGITWPGCNYTLDVVGGWYDAGDFGKYVVNGGIAVWTLMDLYEQLPDAFLDGSLSIPEQANGVADLLDEARWEMQFLLSMQVPQGEPQAGMVHHKIHDESWAPMPMVPPTEVNNDNENKIAGTGRYLFPPSTAATLNLAATGAVCTRIWKNIDVAFSQKCLTAAEIAWKASLVNPDVFAGNTPGQGGGNYEDNNVSDEFYWAASELFITTGKEEYETYLLNSNQFAKIDSFDWGNTAVLGTISLVTVKNELSSQKLMLLKNSIKEYSDAMLKRQNADGYLVLIEGSYPWGSNGMILNNMMLMGLEYRISKENKYLNSVRSSMDYIMGRNPVNQSYVSGYGTYSMQYPHHRFWANDPANGFPPPPSGAVSGGANAAPSDPVALNANLMSLGESKRYVDNIGSFSTNEVAINWNAPLVWVATFLNANNR